MLRSNRWTLGLGAVVVCGLLSTGAATLTAQEEGRPNAGGAQGGGAAPAGGGGRQAGGQDREGARKARQERLAKLKQMIPTAKTSLATAITTVEAQTKGKVFRVAYAMSRDGKFTIEAGVLANDKLGEVIIDPETGKASELKFEDENAPRREGGGGN